MNKKNSYNDNSIKSLKNEQRVRLRPSVIFGSDGLEGCEHSFFEIISNSIDEAKEGYGDVIEIVRYKDKSISIKDYGRGIPLDYNKKEEKYNWELVYCELYAGGKMDRDNYQFSLGLNGLGACATQYASEYFDVEVVKDGYKYNLHFEKGVNIGGLQKTKTKETSSYSFQKWKPDMEVFKDIDIPLENFQNIIKLQSIVNAGVVFKLYDEESDQNFEYVYNDGILGYIKEIDEDKGFTLPVYFEREGTAQDREDKNEYKVKISFAFCFNNFNNQLIYFHNSAHLEDGGSPDRAVKKAFVFEIDKQIKQTNKYNKGEEPITFQDIQDSLVFISNTFSTETSYSNQTKKSIDNKGYQNFMVDVIKEYLEIWFIENKMESDKVIEQILANKRSRETSEKTRLNIKKKLMGNIDIYNQVKKFVDCRSKDTNKRELYIVEGDSALGSCKLGRDADFQGIMPVRGKILNCLKADYNTIFQSDIITDLIKVFGCGVQLQVKKNSKAKNLSDFDIKKLKWDKIIICTDADVDGFQIRTLILTMIYRLTPALIEKGMVYIVETPLFEITYKSKGKTETFFAFDEKEKNNYIKDKNPNNITIQRSKGLGENEPEMMWKTTMCPQTRRLIRVNFEDVQKDQECFELLLGDNLAGRKIFIEEQGHLYLDDVDVS